MHRTDGLQSRLLLAVLLLLIACGDRPGAHDASAASPAPRCKVDDSACFVQLGEAAGFHNEMDNVSFGAFYSGCFFSDQLRSLLEQQQAKDRQAVVDDYIDEHAEKRFRPAALAGCLLAVEDLGLM